MNNDFITRRLFFSLSNAHSWIEKRNRNPKIELFQKSPLPENLALIVVALRVSTIQVWSLHDGDRQPVFLHPSCSRHQGVQIWVGTGERWRWAYHCRFSQMNRAVSVDGRARRHHNSKGFLSLSYEPRSREALRGLESNVGNVLTIYMLCSPCS